MRLHLVDRSADLVREWEAAFRLGTGVGQLPPQHAARAMAEAYAAVSAEWSLNP